MDHANSSDTLSKDKCRHSLFFVWAMEERSVFQVSSFSILCLGDGRAWCLPVSSVGWTNVLDVSILESSDEIFLCEKFPLN